MILYLMGLSLIFAIIAACISIVNWMRWKKIEPDTMKARVFLDRSFIIDNFKLTSGIVVTVGGFVIFHSLMECFDIAGIDFAGFDLIYYGMLPAASGILMVMTYIWYKLLNMRLEQI